MAELLGEIRLEMKTSRAGSIPIGQRDLDGVGPAGYLIVLLNDRLLHGPRWVLARARGLHARTYAESQLADLAEASFLADGLNQRWSDWILDRDVWSRLFEAGSTGVAERVIWCRTEHPPRENQSTGALREMKLSTALDAFRARLDAVAPGGNGSQIEGLIHQALLADVLGQMDYEVTSNPVGVPDIVAKRRQPVAGEDLSARVRAWQPGADRLRETRERLLGLEPEELRELLRVIRGD